MVTVKKKKHIPPLDCRYDKPQSPGYRYTRKISWSELCDKARSSVAAATIGSAHL